MNSFLQIIGWGGLLFFWFWGCGENNGWIAIGVPVFVVFYAAATGNENGPRGGHREPRIAPFDGDGG